MKIYNNIKNIKQYTNKRRNKSSQNHQWLSLLLSKINKWNFKKRKVIKDMNTC